MRWSEAGHYGQAVEAAQGPRVFPEVFQGVGGVAGVSTLESLWGAPPVLCSDGSQLPSSHPFLSRSSAVSKNRAKIGQWVLETGLWLLHRDFLLRNALSCPRNLVQTVETFNITDEKSVIPSSPSLATGMLWPCCAQLEGKTFEGGSKNIIDMHSYLLYKRICLSSDVGKDDCSVSVRVFVNIYLGSRAQTTRLHTWVFPQL